MRGEAPIVTEQPPATARNKLRIPVKQLLKLSHHGLGRRELTEVESQIADYFDDVPITQLLALEELHEDNLQFYKDTLQNRLAVLSTEDFFKAKSARMSPAGREVYKMFDDGIALAVNSFKHESIPRLLGFDPRSLPAPVYMGAFESTLEDMLGLMSLEELMEYGHLFMSPRSKQIYYAVLTSKRR
jgi:hypothetical protein